MICHRCLLRTRTRTRARASQHSLRTLTTSAAKPAQAVSSTAAPTPAPRQGAPGSSHQPAPATSTSAAQPFSTPLTPSPAALGVAPPRKGAGVPVAALSSVPAGTPLRGLNFVKGKSDPVALEDAEYPAWLWGVLKAGAAEGKGEEGEGDLFSKSKKQRRLAAKKLRKQALLHPESLVPKVPLYEQSVDLPAGDGTVDGALQAQMAREELTKAMRAKRRSVIKEANFLRAMG